MLKSVRIYGEKKGAEECELDIIDNMVYSSMQQEWTFFQQLWDIFYGHCSKGYIGIDITFYKLNTTV